MMTPKERQEKARIARDWLPRYTGMPLDKFAKYILLTNFRSYLNDFAARFGVEIYGSEKTMQAATVCGDITIPFIPDITDPNPQPPVMPPKAEYSITMINFGIGAPSAVLICDLLSVIAPHAVLFLGKCGGLRDAESDRLIGIGDYILPTAAIRGEGVSKHYYPKEIPALPSLQLHRVVACSVTANERKFHTGMVYTTNRRLWEHDDHFRSYLQELRCIGIDMETAAFFIAAFANHLPHGALLLVSDMPLVEAKTEASDTTVTANHASIHLKIGIESMIEVMHSGQSVRHWAY
jgi:AMP nucleosidase